MDRKVLIELLRNGMKYPIGKHQLWISRCFEITVRPNKVVEVDEYETYDERNGLSVKSGKRAGAHNRAGMYHVGRSVLLPKDKRVIKEAAGAGWIRTDRS